MIKRVAKQLVSFFVDSMLNENSDVAEDEHMLHFNGTEINKEEEKLAQYALWVEKYTPRYFTELLSDDVSTTFNKDNYYC